MTASVFVFNPFTEGYIAHGDAFTPVKHQVMLAEDLANLPQFLCEPGDIVLVPKRPTAGFLNYLRQAGFQLPEFAEFKNWKIDRDSIVWQRHIGALRPWAWGPDTVKLLEPLVERASNGNRGADAHFNDDIARLYSKAWSASLLKHVLADRAEPWICTEMEIGRAVESVGDALKLVGSIRARGHQRVVVKEALGLAGHNAIRLWEPTVSQAQRKWLAHAVDNGRELIIEPWLERELDFSVQLEMGPRHLEVCGYTGLINDRKGQFLANWANADYNRRLPARVAALLPTQAGGSERLQQVYAEIFLILEAELRRVRFVGPVSIDSFVYRTREGDCRLKPIVEINPRYTMGRLTVELMKRAGHGASGLFRLVTQAQVRAEGFADFSSYARASSERLPLELDSKPVPKIRKGWLCLNNPEQAQVCLATFEVGPMVNLPGWSGDNEPPARD